MIEKMKIKFDDNHSLQGYFWHGDGEPKAFIQLSHGMAEHLLRYDGFAEFFVSNGYAVIGSDHYAHGYSAKKVEDIGVIDDMDFMDAMIKSMKVTREHFKDVIKDKPVYLFSHSMGSMTAQRYLELYPDDFTKAVICGTDCPSAKYSFAKIVSSAVMKKHGKISYVPFMENLGCGAFNNKFKKEGEFAWLSTNKDNVEKYIADKMCGIQFPTVYYNSMAKMMISAGKNVKLMSKKVEYLIIAGACDPVGNFGKAPKTLYKKYKRHGLDVDCIIYANARHEIHNEVPEIRSAVFNDVLAFFNK